MLEVSRSDALLQKSVAVLNLISNYYSEVLSLKSMNHVRSQTGGRFLLSLIDILR